MSTLDISLMLLTILFWAGSVSYYFRAPILHWIDNRVPYEPLAGKLRALLRPGRK